MADDRDRRDLWECSECHLGIAVDDETIQGVYPGERFHVHADGRACGPIIAVPVRPLAAVTYYETDTGHLLTRNPDTGEWEPWDDAEPGTPDRD